MLRYSCLTFPALAPLPPLASVMGPPRCQADLSGRRNKPRRARAIGHFVVARSIAKRSAGVTQFRVFRGLALSSAAAVTSSSARTTVPGTAS